MATAKKAVPPAEEKAADKAAEVVPDGGVGGQDEVVNPGQVELQKTVDKAEEQGFYGVEADPTPDANYTVEGVTSGAPTPEHDGGNA